MVFHCIFLGKKAIIITSKHGTRILFFALQSYSKKALRKHVPKSIRKYKRNVLTPPGHPIILLIIHSKYFPDSDRLKAHDQLLMTKFGRILCVTRK